MDKSTRPSRTGRRILWSVPALCAVLGLAFAFVGLETAHQTLAINPCAGAIDNPFARVAQIAFLAGVGSSIAIVIFSAVTKNRDAVFFGTVAAVAGLLVMLAGMVLAGAGYGWHCPEY